MRPRLHRAGRGERELRGFPLLSWWSSDPRKALAQCSARCLQATPSCTHCWKIDLLWGQSRASQAGSAFPISCSLLGKGHLSRSERGGTVHHILCPQHHMDPSSNFCNYRTALQGATQRSQMANSSREKIVIPVFNLFVKDIYFLHKIHTNHLPNGHINFKVSSACWGLGAWPGSPHTVGSEGVAPALMGE